MDGGDHIASLALAVGNKNVGQYCYSVDFQILVSKHVVEVLDHNRNELKYRNIEV